MAVENAILDQALKKYGIPEWVKPYVYTYIKSDPLNAVRKGLSFIDVKRKRGKVTNAYVELPNSVKFELDDLVYIISMFYHGEEESTKVLRLWLKDAQDFQYKEYAEHFEAMAASAEKQARAIKNMLEGLGKKSNQINPVVQRIFDYMKDIREWPERIIAYDIIIKKSYGSTFGSIFYKVFYPVMPEYMRTFGKAFNSDESIASWGEAEAARLIREGAVNAATLERLFGDMLPMISESVNANLGIAEKVGIKQEVLLLRDIAVAYPLQFAKENGLEIDINAFMKDALQRK
ncbi:MAG: hypothetical protein M1125_02300 [Candidatus Marsarchaeota archaeon]|nr:hypothetical protein [Candidatus Marsarchaeota archaeon]